MTYQKAIDPSTGMLDAHRVWAIADNGTGTFISDTDPGWLAYIQGQQNNTLTAAYQNAIQQSVSYASKGGVTKTYQADPQSVANLSQMLLAFQAAGAVPSGFYWVAADNTQVLFTYADMQGLAQTMGTQGLTAFQKLQTLKAQVNAATTVAAVQAVVWS